MNSKTIISLIGGSVILGGGVFLGSKWYSSKNEGSSESNEEKKLLLKILDEVKLEYAPILSTYASIIKGMEAETTNARYKEQAKMMITGRMRETVNQVSYSRNNLV